MKKVVALMTMNNPMDSQAFDVLLRSFAASIWSGA